MGKGSRNRVSSEQEKQIANEKLKKEKRIRRRKRLTIGCMCLVLALAIGTYITVITVNDAMVKNGTTIRKLDVVKADDCTFNGAMMTFMAYSSYHTFAQNYADNLESYGLDTSVDIKEQNYSEDETWFDYFLNGAKTQAEEYAALYTAAKHENVSLSDTERKTMEEAVKKIDTDDYGKVINEDDVRDCYEIIYLAQKYYTVVSEEFKPDDTLIESYYNENINSFRTCSYASYELTSDAADYDVWLKKLQNAEDLASFKSIVTSYQTDIVGADAETAASAADAVEQTGKSYTKDDAVSEWAFDAARAVYDTHYVESDTGATVYMLTSLPARNETKTVDVRHILLTPDTYGDDDKTNAKAEEILNGFTTDGGSEDDFAKLAEEYTEDPGSASNGGLYSGVTEGQMVTEFNDWCFAAERKTGDTGIVKTSYGCHIMYFVGALHNQWQNDVEDKIISERYSEHLDRLKSDYHVKTDDDMLKKL